MKTFSCNFGGGVSCTVQVPDVAPPKDKPEAHIREHAWTGKATPALLRPYIAWINSVNTLLAKEWGVKLMHCFQVGKGKFEVWVYEPDKPPKRVHV